MGIPQITLGKSILYTKPRQENKKNINNLERARDFFVFFFIFFKQKGGKIFCFLLAFFRKRGEYCRFFSTKRPNFQKKLIFEQRK